MCEVCARRRGVQVDSDAPIRFLRGRRAAPRGHAVQTGTARSVPLGGFGDPVATDGSRTIAPDARHGSGERRRHPFDLAEYISVVGPRLVRPTDVVADEQPSTVRILAGALDHKRSTCPNHEDATATEFLPIAIHKDRRAVRHSRLHRLPAHTEDDGPSWIDSVLDQPVVSKVHTGLRALNADLPNLQEQWGGGAQWGGLERWGRLFVPRVGSCDMVVLLAKAKFSAYPEFSVHQDTILAPELETVAIPVIGGIRFTIDQQPVSAWVARTGVHLRWRRAGTESGRVVFETRASASRTTAVGASAYNRTWANVSSGPRVQYSVAAAGRPWHGLFHADAGLEQRWRGGAGYATSPWAAIGLDQDISRNWRVTAAPRVWVTHRDQDSQTSRVKGRSLGLNVSRRLGAGWLTAGGKISRETTKNHGQRWKSHDVSLRYAAEIGRDWSLSVRTGLIRTRFDAEDRLFLKRRGDQTRDVGISVSHRALAMGGYLPELTLNACPRSSWYTNISSVLLPH